MIIQKDTAPVIDLQQQRPDNAAGTPGSSGPVGEKEIKLALETLQKYKQGKANLEARIVENEQWYRLRHWEVMRGKKPQGDNASKNRVEPASAWLFNAVANKHADAMDNFPEPNVLAREQMDEQEAKILSSIIPVILERNDFEEVYSDNWWYKLKTGTAVYGVFWDNSIDNGVGDVSVKKLDILNVFWQPGITDIQKTRNLFITDLVDNDILESMYPQLKGRLSGKTVDVADYVYDDDVDTENKSVVIDWYYKKQAGSRAVLHYAKFVGSTLLYASENDPNHAERGWYDHGKYPVVFDVLYPEEGTCFGFGYVDICKDPQIYIDKMDQLLIENTLQAGRTRYFTKDNSAINLEEFADWSKDFVHVAGSLEENNIKRIETKQLDMGILNHLQWKVDELKETSGNRDVNQGSTSGGVTAAAAIAALQEAGNKLSRDIIKASYRSYTQINYIVIELIRQFYDFGRTFRIDGEGNAVEYLQYSNEGLKPKQAMLPGGIFSEKLPIFDIKIKPQRSNPFSRMSQNELAKELYSGGMFNPEMADQALIALEMMDFEGKETVVEKVRLNQQLLLQMQQMIGMMQQMAGIAPAPGMEGQAAAGPAQPQPQLPEGKQKSSVPQDNGIASAVNNSTTPYGEKLAKRATVKVE